MIAGSWRVQQFITHCLTHTQAANAEAISMAINCDRGVCELLLEHHPDESLCLHHSAVINTDDESASGGPRLLIWLERFQLSSKCG